MMKINTIALSTSMVAFLIAAAGCTNSTDTRRATLPEPTVSGDTMSDDVHTDDSEHKAYAPFFTYPYQAGAEIEPAMGGTLVMQGGCLLLQHGDRITVPVFPHGITTWNEKTQTLTANGVAVPLNTELFTNGPLHGGKYDPDKDYDFEQQADPNCLNGRYIEFLGSQFMQVNQ